MFNCLIGINVNCTQLFRLISFSHISDEQQFQSLIIFIFFKDRLSTKLIPVVLVIIDAGGRGDGATAAHGR